MWCYLCRLWGRNMSRSHWQLHCNKWVSYTNLCGTHICILFIVLSDEHRIKMFSAFVTVLSLDSHIKLRHVLVMHTDGNDWNDNWKGDLPVHTSTLHGIPGSRLHEALPGIVSVQGRGQPRSSSPFTASESGTLSKDQGHIQYAQWQIKGQY